ncbi:MAG TPA: hypothetical protein VFU11_04315 [Solirubrobacterales bacterium]|nr:hypothetical protein [Solirubrobacterales bacterium]
MMRLVWAGLCAAIAASALALAGATGALAGAATPPARTFFGIAPQTSLGPADFTRLEGVAGTLRLPFNWPEIERRPGVYEFSALDDEIRAAAAHGIVVLPVVYGTPTWLSADPARPPLASPRARRAWMAFLAALVDRYGPHGSAWFGLRRRAPIRFWQIWNEPNFRLFWHPHPAPRRYARLLDISARALRHADPGARVVSAGVAPVGAGIPPWYFLRRLFRVSTVRRNVDVVALHPYAATVSYMGREIEATRLVLDEAGARRLPILISELGVASWGSFPSAFVQGEAGQAAFLRGAFSWLLRHRLKLRIAGVDWFTWKDIELPDRHCAFCQGAGLLDVEGQPKPAWGAYRQAVGGSRTGAPGGGSR